MSEIRLKGGGSFGGDLAGNHTGGLPRRSQDAARGKRARCRDQSSLLTSWGLRDYGTATWEGGEEGCDHRHETAHQKQGATSGRAGRSNIEDQRNENFRIVCGKCGARRIDNQIGLEATPELHIEALLAVFHELWRVLRKDGTLWLNYGDCYACAPNGRKASDIEEDDRTFRDKPFSTASRPGGRTGDGGPRRGANRNGAPCPINLKAKDLVMMPYRLAIALQTDGWYVRSAITICKNNPMPESVTDRPTQATEMLFLLTKSERYFMDMDAIREPHTEPWRSTGKSENRGTKDIENGVTGGFGLDGVRPREYNPAGRNKRNWWLINSQPMKDAHYAAFSEKLVEPCILAGTSEWGCCEACGSQWIRNGKDGWKPGCLCGNWVCRTCHLVIEYKYGTKSGTMAEVAVREVRADVLSGQTQENLLQPEVLCSRREDSAGQGMRIVRESVPPEGPDEPVLQQVLFGKAYGHEQEELSGLVSGPEGLSAPLYAEPSNGLSGGIPDGASVSDGNSSGADAGTERSGSPHQRQAGRQPDRESRTDDEETPRQDSEGQEVRHLSRVQMRVPTSGCCPRCNATLIHEPLPTQPSLVLDCFAGSGTVSRVASRLGRRSIGIELSEEYVNKIARKRTSQGSLGL